MASRQARRQSGAGCALGALAGIMIDFPALAGFFFGPEL
jgi:hypothetical protein